MSSKQAVTKKTAAGGKGRTSGKKSNHQKNKKKSSNKIIVVCSAILAVMVVGAVGGYSAGKSYYKGKFLANTTINGISVGSESYETACRSVDNKTVADSVKITGIDGKVTEIKTADFDYKSNTAEEVKKIYDSVNHSAWFSGLVDGAEYTFDEKYTYSKEKLTELLKKANWGDTDTADASIAEKDGKYEIVKEVQGNKIENMDNLVTAVLDQVDKGNLSMDLTTETGCYKTPSIVSDDLTMKCDNLNKVADISIGFDFDYTVEKLSGKTLADLLNFEDDGTYTVDRDKCMKYVEKLAKKYDTFNTERKFHATLQGDIIVPTSSDAKYGWWIYQNGTCDKLVELLEKGKSVEKTEPVYYQDGGFSFTGLKSARSANGDIGNTYVEVDLSAQHLWVYKKGKKVFECDIVSGQTTTEARTTLPGVYKVWYKDTNYRMKDTNADGDNWDVTCNYWNSISPVGIGLHDSTWRGNAFGGDIYTYNGSHGCINMPLEGAKYIYDNVAYDTPVVMYYQSAR